MRGIAIALVAWVVFGAGVAAGQEKYDPRKAHQQSDRNGDGLIDREEFHHRMVDVFFHGDADKDGYMSAVELRRTVVFPEDFADSDRDDDGRVSMYEFIEIRFYTFDQFDEDDDGRLSLPEVIDAYEARQ